MRIGLVVVATGKYQRFIPDLWTSSRQWFFAGKAELLLLTDNWDAPTEPDIHVLHIPHQPWPGPTLFRYHSLCDYSHLARGFDYLFQCDADMRFVAPVGEEILGELVATRHPGYFGQTPRALPYERRPASQACVKYDEGAGYFAGGFQGGRAERFLEAANHIARNVQVDKANGITAAWHDESHWNRYLIDNPPDVVLSPAYCYPESWSIPFERKLLALDKDHQAMRA